MISGISQNPINSLNKMLRFLPKEQEELSEDSAGNTVMAPVIETINNQVGSSHAAKNLLTRNFVSAERGQSRYVEASLIGLKADQQMNDEQQSTLTSILDSATLEYESAKTSGERYIAIKRAEKKIALYQSDEVLTLAEKTHLKESKKKLTEKAQEATAPQDENGRPIEDLAVENTEAPTPVPVQDVSEPETPPVAETSESASEVPATPNSTPEASAPAMPSIKVTV